jgi:SAM-dependent methyltransferase
MESNYKVGDLIYDANIYDGMNTNLDDLQFYKRWLPKNKNARILELCCGTGRLTLPIAQDGYDITGVDYTFSMLEQARVKALEAGVEVEFIEADIRTLDLPETYDLIFIPFNSIHHLYKNDDLFKAFNVVKNHLKEGGLFLLDCFNPNIQFIAEGGKALKEIAEYTTNDGREVLIKEIMRYENKTQINRIEWHYYINGVFDSIQNLDMRLFFPQELDSYLEWNGFNIINKFGSFEEDPFNDNSEKQIFVCQ